jgi:lysophospholipase L1-like esterase
MRNPLRVGRHAARGAWVAAALGAMICSLGAAPGTRPAAAGTEPGDVPTLFIAGDSTAASNNPAAMGWGIRFQEYFDPTKLRIVNGARSGLSTRTFINSGAWEAIISKVKPNDYVILQFGHNDNGPVDAFRFRGTMPSLGDETQEAHTPQGQPETVHTFGWYMKKMIGEVKAKNANPIIMSMTPRGEWKDGKVERGFGDYARLAGELAKAERLRYIDLTNMVADRYEELGEAAVKPFFPRDTTHTSAEGAKVNAEYVIAGFKAIHEYALINALSAKGRTIETGPAKYALPPKLPVPRGAAREVFQRWLNLPDVQDPALPTVFLIGDSTVRNGRGDGVDGQWGWGDPLAVYFDPAKVNLVNRAVGGTSSHSFITAGYWDAVLQRLKPGDYVLLQFGTNDNGGTSLPGVGEDTAPGRGGGEPTHTFGWYLRKYIADARAKGATPIVCTLVPRNVWKDSKITRTPNTHADWARQVAKDQNVGLLDLYESIASAYDGLGQEKTTELFADKRVHTGREGAELSAKIVLNQIRTLPGDPLRNTLREKPAANW